MGSFKEAPDNPLHQRFGIINNILFVLNRAKKYCPSVIPLGMICMIFGSMQECLRLKLSTIDEERNAKWRNDYDNKRKDTK